MYKLIYTAVFLLAALGASAQNMPERSEVRRGNRQYNKGNYEKSIERYERALEAAPESFEATYNLGNALYKAERFDKAEQTMRRAAADSLRTDEERAEAFYNLGNAQFKQQKYKEALESGKAARTVELDKEERKTVSDLNLLTDKPVLYVCNVDEASAVSGNAYVEAVREAIRDENAELLIVAAATEADIAELESFEEREAFLADVGLKESGVSRLIKAAYRLLDLQTYFTTGPDESRAWTFTKGTKAPQAAGIIHTDFERGFIRAEVIKYDDYIALGSEKACREAGKIAIEGKEYVVQDGDIMHFLFNV